MLTNLCSLGLSVESPLTEAQNLGVFATKKGERLISDTMNNLMALPKLHIEHTPFSTAKFGVTSVGCPLRIGDTMDPSARDHILVVHPHGTIQHDNPAKNNSGRVAKLTKDGFKIGRWLSKNTKLL